MPQLLPFYFVNQLSFALFGLFIVIYVMSRFVLPAFVELFITRMYITKLLFTKFNSGCLRTRIYKIPIYPFHLIYHVSIFATRPIRSN